MRLPAAVLLMFATALALTWWQSHQRLGRPGVILTVDEQQFAFPADVPGYAGKAMEIAAGVRSALPPDTTLGARAYTAKDGFWMQMFGVLMGTDRTSIHQPEFCLAGIGVQVVEKRRDVLRVGGEEPYDLPIMVLRTEKELEGQMYPGVYIYWFVADGVATERHWEWMWWMARELIASGELQRWAYVGTLGMTLPGEEAQLLQRMKEFLAQAVPHFQPRPEFLAHRAG